MTMDFDLVIDSEDNTVDMKSGLETLQGASNATRCIAETLLTNIVPEKQSHKGRVRTNLKHSFKGSYGHIFSLDIYDESLKRRFTEIGRETFAELVHYFINESLYLQTDDLSEKAQMIISQLGYKSDELMSQLRKSALKNMHTVSSNFGLGVKLRYRRNSESIELLAAFNEETSFGLSAKISPVFEDITASITRLNITTGNGRLLVRGANETVAFGFLSKYRELKVSAKKIFSENLDHNNGLPSDQWRLINLKVRPIKLFNGRVIKYMVTGIYNEAI